MRKISHGVVLDHPFPTFEHLRSFPQPWTLALPRQLTPARQSAIPEFIEYLEGLKSFKDIYFAPTDTKASCVTVTVESKEALIPLQALDMGETLDIRVGISETIRWLETLSDEGQKSISSRKAFDKLSDATGHSVKLC